MIDGKSTSRNPMAIALKKISRLLSGIKFQGGESKSLDSTLDRNHVATQRFTHVMRIIKHSKIQWNGTSTASWKEVDDQLHPGRFSTKPLCLFAKPNGHFLSQIIGFICQPVVVRNCSCKINKMKTLISNQFSLHIRVCGSPKMKPTHGTEFWRLA